MTASGRLVFGNFAALTEFERELIREKTIAASPPPAPARRPALYDDARQDAPDANRHGQARYQGW